MGKKLTIVGIVVLIVLLTGVGVYWALGFKATGVANREIPPSDTAALWQKRAVIYNLDVKVFKDSNGDGIGDFNGLTQKLGYLDSLGITALWLAPFQPSPEKDDGYDIVDYYGVDERVGTISDFKRFMNEARLRHIRVIMDLVVNHTSNQHPWFAQSRSNLRSPFHDWYTWAKKRPSNYKKGMVFPGVQQTIWTYDAVAGQYYYHRFYDFQPDLNVQHPAVMMEIRRIIKYWMDMGLDGFRIDAVPFLIEEPRTHGKDFERHYEMLVQLRTYIQSLRADAILLGEANVLPNDNKHYFGAQGEEMNMMFNFYVNQYLFYALATGNTRLLMNALAKTSDIPPGAQWAQFLRNHDEVDLGRLSNTQRKQVYKAFGPDTNMQLYDRGIRRRLAPMLGNAKLIRMAYNVLFSLPSTPVLRYGDELGMGDDLSLKERLSVRTPMQWNDQKNGGFSDADNVVRPVISHGVYNYRIVNAARELTESTSLLSWIRRLIQLRKSCPEISYGQWNTVNVGSDLLLALSYRWQGKNLLIIHNFSGKATPAMIPASNTFTLKNLFDHSTLKTQKIGLKLLVAGYGSCWFRQEGE